MDAGRGVYVCGVVLGLSLGFAAAHLAFVTERAHSPRMTPSAFRSELLLAAEPSGPWVESAFADEALPSTGVVRIAELPHEEFAADDDREPALLRNISDASPIQSPGDQVSGNDGQVVGAVDINTPHIPPLQRDPGLRAVVDRELAGHSAADCEMWCDVLQGLSAEQAAGVLQFWKMGHAGPMTFAGPGAAPPPTAPVAAAPIAADSPDADPVAPIVDERPGSRAHEAPRTAMLADVSWFPPAPEQLRAVGPASDGAHVAAAIHRYNLANAHAIGFKRWIPEYRESLLPASAEAPADAAPPEVLLSGMVLDMSRGPIAATGRPLDAAPLGDWLFVLKHDEQTVYSRNGHFERTPTGLLGLRVGRNAWASVDPPVELAENAAYLLSPDGAVYLAEDGASPREHGRLQFAQVEYPSGLKPLGGGLFVATEAAGAVRLFFESAAYPVLLDFGFLERSNVDADAERRELAWLRDCQTQGVRFVDGRGLTRPAAVDDVSGRLIERPADVSRP